MTRLPRRSRLRRLPGLPCSVCACFPWRERRLRELRSLRLGDYVNLCGRFVRDKLSICLPSAAQHHTLLTYSSGVTRCEAGGSAADPRRKIAPPVELRIRCHSIFVGPRNVSPEYDGHDQAEDTEDCDERCCVSKPNLSQPSSAHINHIHTQSHTTHRHNATLSPPAMMMPIKFLIIPLGWLIPIPHSPRPHFQVPTAAPQFANIMHMAAPAYPLEKGEEREITPNDHFQILDRLRCAQGLAICVFWPNAKSTGVTTNCEPLISR